MTPISGKDIWNQLKYDAVGKDAYRGITLTYGWMANQVGHVALGFIPSFIVYWILNQGFNVSDAGLKATIGVSAFWLVFEAWNCFWPLRRDRKKYTFQPDYRNIIFDTATDVVFFWIGACALCIFIQQTSTPCWILFGLLLIVAYPTRYWFLTKLYQQSAGYPCQFRLAQWKSDITPAAKQIILSIANSKQSVQHLLVFGAYKSGKTTLAVAIANEQSIRHQSCIYVTTTKLFSLFSIPATSADKEAGMLWTWREAEVLVIDDINPGIPLDQELVTPTVFLHYLQQGGLGPENMQCLLNKKVIWVLGNGSNTNKLHEQNWKDFVQNEIGVSEENIYSITLKPIDATKK